MADDFPKLLKSFIVITLFAFLVIGFSVAFLRNIDDKSDTYNITDKGISQFEERLGATNIATTIEGMNERADTWSEIFNKQSIFSTIAGIIVTGMFDLAKTMWTFISFPFQLISAILTGILGVPPIVTTIIQVLLTVSVIFGVWYLVRIGRMQ
jgi:vacuolar-type H+-ATPase subunit I/STV1